MVFPAQVRESIITPRNLVDSNCFKGLLLIRIALEEAFFLTEWNKM